MRIIVTMSGSTVTRFIVTGIIERSKLLKFMLEDYAAGSQFAFQYF